LRRPVLVVHLTDSRHVVRQARSRGFDVMNARGWREEARHVMPWLRRGGGSFDPSSGSGTFGIMGQ
jgi:hypothetical protein